uniref:SEA domain-containing protein n=1 Tax=Parastrongyloides trichosuri TaxID=131310 RepID=A0A0N5A6J4_PARTI
MQKLVILCLLALLATITLCNSHETSCSKEAKDDKETCSDIVDENGTSGKPLLLEALYNISFTLTGTDQTTFNTFISYLDSTYFESGNYTSIEIVLECSFEIYKFFTENIDFCSGFFDISIGSWGTFNNFFQVGIYLSADKFGGCWSENSSGQYDILIAFQNFQATLSQSEQASFSIYIQQLTVIINSGEESSEKYTQLYSLILQIISNTQWSSSFLSFQCGEMGSFYMLYQITIEYYRISLIPDLFSGPAPCGFVEGLESCLSNTSYTISASDKAYINATFQKFQVVISDSSLSVVEQMQEIVYIYEQFLITFYYLEDVFLSFQISAEFGTFEEFLEIYAFGQTQSCWPEGLESTGPPVSVTEAATEGITIAETEAVTEEITIAETEAATEEITIAETEAATEGITIAETEAVTEEITIAETEAATEEITVAETEVVTKEITIAETEAATEEITVSETEVTIPPVVTCVPFTVPTTSISSTVSTTLLSTTKKATTTLPTTGNCATATKNCLALSGNWSVIYTSSTKQWGSWTASQKTNWKNECTQFTKKYIKNTALTPVKKIQGVVSSIEAYVKTYTYMKAKIFAIKIGTWGTISQMCGCY